MYDTVQEPTQLAEILGQSISQALLIAAIIFAIIVVPGLLIAIIRNIDLEMIWIKRQRKKRKRLEQEYTFNESPPKNTELRLLENNCQSKERPKYESKHSPSELNYDNDSYPEMTAKKPIVHKPKYTLSQSILTSRELRFFKTLLPVANEIGLFVAVKPRLADFIRVNLNQYEKGSGYFTYFNKINKKHVDFLLCEPYAMKPTIAIELDDSSHHRVDRMARDDFVNETYEEIGLPVIRVYDYTNETLREKLKATMEL